MAELKTFSIVVSFLLIYSALLGTMPAGFMTATYETPELADIDPQLIVGFENYVTYNSTNFTAGGLDYGFGGHLWSAVDTTGIISLYYRTILFLIIPVYTAVTFTFEGGFDRGESDLTWVQIQTDSEEGITRYTAKCPQVSSGLVFMWNTSDYLYAWDAWGNDSLLIVHGVGADIANAPLDVLSLLFAMLTYSVADIPPLLQVLLNSPIYASVLFLIWFFIKEVIPFL